MANKNNSLEYKASNLSIEVRFTNLLADNSKGSLNKKTNPKKMIGFKINL